MNLLDDVRERSKERKRRRAQMDIHTALDRAYGDAPTRDVTVDQSGERFVIFSDHHKGGRDGADDFQRCERTYNAALAYYNALAYQLIELGDVEELWENSFEEVATHYPRTLALAAGFHRDGRYTRLWGNHDLAWSDKTFFQERMAGYGYGNVEPMEAVRLAVTDRDRKLIVEVFLVHGHQGTADSDRNATASRLFVRYGWRRLQRALNRPWNTPSVDWGLRGEHAKHMAAWAAKNRRVLIAGHTHKPVFFQSAKQPAVTPADVSAPDDAPDPVLQQALSLARTEWAKAEVERLTRQPPITLDKPCYFNTGCCSYGDGDITGLEIRENEIWLVRWPCIPQTKPIELAHMSLNDIAQLVA